MKRYAARLAHSVAPASRCWSRLLGWLVLLLLALAAPAHAEQRLRYELYVDPTREVTFPEVTGKPFQPIGETFGGGFTTSIYWLRVTVEDPDPGTFRLRFRPTTTDRIILYTPRQPSGWLRSQNGERLTPSGDAAISLNWYAFDIRPDQDGGPWYVRIDTQSPGAITVTTIPVTRVMPERVASAAFNALNFALLCLATVILVGALQPLRSLSNFGFLAMIVGFGIYLFTTNGYSRILFGLSAHTAEATQEFFAAFTVATLAIFHYVFLREFRPARFARWLSLALAVFSTFGPIASLLGYGTLSLKLALSTYVALVPVLVMLLVTLRHDASMKRWQVRCVYSAYLAAICFNITARFGLIDVEFLYRYSIQAVTMVTSTLMLALLWLQNRHEQAAATGRALALDSLSVALDIDRQFNAARLALLERIDAQVTQISRGLREDGIGATHPRASRALAGMRRVIDRCLFAHEATVNRWNLRHVRFAPATALQSMADTLAPPELVRFTLPSGAPLIVTTDRDLFEIAAENVLSNALRYGLHDHPVGIELTPAQNDGRDGVRICVTNAARALPFDASRVFEKFYRGTSSADQGGTGLGLFITREVVQALSGTVTIETSPAPHGSDVTVCIWLPVSP